MIRNTKKLKSRLEFGISKNTMLRKRIKKKERKKEKKKKTRSQKL